MPSLSTSTKTYAQGNQAWRRTNKGLKTPLTVTLDVTTLGAFTNGYIPAGVTLGIITADGTYGPYDNAAVDGRTVMRGFLLNDEALPTGATKIVTAMITEGDIVESRLPTGHGLDANGKTDVGNRFTYV
jgi:hypothetical protein